MPVAHNYDLVYEKSGTMPYHNQQNKFGENSSESRPNINETWNGSNDVKRNSYSTLNKEKLTDENGYSHLIFDINI